MNDENLIRFHKETGIWPNGKDKPPMLYQNRGLELFEDKERAYGLWQKYKQLKDENQRLKEGLKKIRINASHTTHAPCIANFKIADELLENKE